MAVSDQHDRSATGYPRLLRSASRSRKQLQTDCLCAFVFNLEISRHCVRPNVQGVRLAGMAIFQHPQLGRRPIELGLIVQNDRGVGAGRQGGEPAFRCEVLIKMRHIVGEIELGAAGINNGQRPAMVMHLKNARDRSGGVARRPSANGPWQSAHPAVFQSANPAFTRSMFCASVIVEYARTATARIGPAALAPRTRLKFPTAKGFTLAAISESD